MSDFTNAEVFLQTSITKDRAFLAAQDEPATIDATLASLRAIGIAIQQWARAEISLESICKTSEELVESLEKERLQDLNQGADKFSSYVAELRRLIEDFAKKAREA
jgi:hypothetical protein